MEKIKFEDAHQHEWDADSTPPRMTCDCDSVAMTTDNRTNEPTKAMILDALNAYSSKGLEIDGYGPTDEYPSLDMWGERLASQMRAALVAAQGARQPSEDDDTAFEAGMDEVDWDMVRDGVGDPQEAAGVAVRAALSRAAVPDAATELTSDHVNALLRMNAALDRADAARAERDAALAAIERVRAINTGNNRALYGNDFEAGMAKALWLVKTALDGAPEPEEKP